MKKERRREKEQKETRDEKVWTVLPEAVAERKYFLLVYRKFTGDSGRMYFICIPFRGKAAGIVGGLSVVSFVIDIYGMYCAVQGFLERDRRYLNCKIGLGVGVITLILFMAILVGGLG